MQALIERGMTALFSLRGGRLALPIILGLLVVIFFSAVGFASTDRNRRTSPAASAVASVNAAADCLAKCPSG